MFLGAIYMVQIVPGEIRDELLIPLRNQGPVIRVSYMWFSLGGMILGGLLTPVLIGLVLWFRFFRISESLFQWLMHRIFQGLFVGVILLLPVPMLVGKGVSVYVATQGYESCGALREFGFMHYAQTFVASPELCVPKNRLDAALRRWSSGR